MQARRFDVALVLGAAVAIRIAFAFETAADPLFRALAIDARFYRDVAASVAAGDFLLGRDPLWFAPLYPLGLGALFRVFGPAPEVAIWLQWGLGIATAGLAWRLGRRFSRAAGLAAGLTVALMPTLLVYEFQLLYTTLAVFLAAAFLGAFLAAARDGGDGGDGRAGAAGAWLGALALVASSALLFAPVAAWQLLRRRGRRAACFFAIGVAAWLLPVLLRNGLVAGAWTALPVNGGMLFATGFDPESRGGRAQVRTPADFGPSGSYRRDAEAAAGRSLSLAEASRWHRDRALERIAADPGWAAGLVARKIALLFSAREIDDNLGHATFAERALPLRWLPAAWAWVLVPGAFGAALAFGRRDPAAADARSVAMFALVFALSLLPFFVTARYRAPLVVPLAVLAGYAIRVGPEVVRANARRAVLAALVAVVTLVLALRDPGVRGDPALELNAMGAALLNEGRAAEADDLLSRALAKDPELAGAHANRALALLALGRSDDALDAARTATRLDDGLASAWMTQGAILARAGQVSEALPAYRRAAELAPSDAGAVSGYARCLAAVGDWGGAITVGERAVALGDRALAPALEEWRSEASGP